jgi:hypothetical protein
LETGVVQKEDASVRDGERLRKTEDGGIPGTSQGPVPLGAEQSQGAILHQEQASPVAPIPYFGKRLGKTEVMDHVDAARAFGKTRLQFDGIDAPCVVDPVEDHLEPAGQEGIDFRSAVVGRSGDLVRRASGERPEVVMAVRAQ